MEDFIWQRLTEGETGSCSDGWGHVAHQIGIKSLIQFSVDGQGWVPSLLFHLRPNYGGGIEDNVDLFQEVLCLHCHTQCPQPCSSTPNPRLRWRLLNTHWQVWLVSCGVTAPFSLVLVHKVLFMHSKRLFPSPVYVLAALWWC